MRILYFDIDSLRPDHLGCHGYARRTSPHIDALAHRGLRFSNCYTSDAPCLPSRTAFLSGRFGINNGVINHGGVASQPPLGGIDRSFRDLFCSTSLPAVLRSGGYRTAVISSFAERHSAWHWYAGFTDIINTGRGGQESAHEVSPEAMDWLDRHGANDNWFLYVNLWDPHTPYRVPAEYGHPFAGEPYPEWLTEEIHRQHWASAGPHGAREIDGWTGELPDYLVGREFPRQPWEAPTEREIRQMFDGYDTGVSYADKHVGRILEQLAQLGVAEETAIIVSGDHGENLGELGIYGDHQTADQCTSRVPWIMTWPGFTEPRAGQLDDRLLYSLDGAATLIDLAGCAVPENWDGQSFREEIGRDTGKLRNNLVVSQAAWSCQRTVRWDRYLCIHSYHDGFHNFPETMLFDIEGDPHELHDLAPARPDLVSEAGKILDAWKKDCLGNTGLDPMDIVLSEGGPFHTRGELNRYLERLRRTDRAGQAEILECRHRTT